LWHIAAACDFIIFRAHSAATFFAWHLLFNASLNVVVAWLIMAIEAPAIITGNIFTRMIFWAAAARVRTVIIASPIVVAAIAISMTTVGVIIAIAFVCFAIAMVVLLVVVRRSCWIQR
jgi:hypothetical protein